MSLVVPVTSAQAAPHFVDRDTNGSSKFGDSMLRCSSSLFSKSLWTRQKTEARDLGYGCNEGYISLDN